MFCRVELLCIIVNSFFGLSLFLVENNIVVIIFFNRCTVHFEDSLSITHQQMH
jgi:hypothetical protein